MPLHHTGSIILYSMMNPMGCRCVFQNLNYFLGKLGKSIQLNKKFLK